MKLKGKEIENDGATPKKSPLRVPVSVRSPNQRALEKQ